MPNRLARATSPYLLQHADNPVDWYPWGVEALARARAEDRPILLSIGYSACHWCHVMERESFEDPETARLMNERFVNVKVDREERPDVDQVYMKAVQAMTGGGGWPLTVFLTPEAEPYYGGTYFPPEPRAGMPSFPQVIQAAADAYGQREADVRAAAGRLLDALRRADVAGSASAEGGAAPDATTLERAYRDLEASYDPTWGGFGGSPKFPQPTTIEVLLRIHARTGEARALDMAVHTLRRMAAGGIRDHLAGGFHRYSVDARWLVPHFEKMLYDNALLARLYVDAWRVTGADDLREVATETLDWMLDDLRAPEGGFYGARDADSEGEEGRYYVWTSEEVGEAAGEDADLFRRTYDVTTGGNFEGRNILHLPHPLASVAEREGHPPAELFRRLARARETLLAARARRPEPLRDEKVLAGWSAMAIRAFAEAGAALQHRGYLDAARTGAAFVLDAMRPEGRLLHVYKDGVARVPGFLDDHAALGNALLSLHAATLEPMWLGEARRLVQETIDLFRDPGSGRFHDTARDAERLVLRPRDAQDGATPSGNSLAAELLLRAGRLFGEDAWVDAARDAVIRERAALERFPRAFGRLLTVLDGLLADPVDVVVVGARDAEATRALQAVVGRRYLAGASVAGREPGEELPGRVPVLEGRDLVDGHPTAYVCRAGTCRRPTAEPVALETELDAAGLPRGRWGDAAGAADPLR